MQFIIFYEMYKNNITSTCIQCPTNFTKKFGLSELPYLFIYFLFLTLYQTLLLGIINF